MSRPLPLLALALTIVGLAGCPSPRIPPSDGGPDVPIPPLDAPRPDALGLEDAPAADAPGADAGAPDDAGPADGATAPEDGGPSCGDGVRNGGEACDGTDLGPASCASEGFVSGDLACTPACALDTSGCVACGNDRIDPGEDCDGTDVGTATCATEGFTDGALACASDCTFETSACTTCGDGAIEPGEVCDGTNVGTATCTTVPGGFSDGTLGCTSDCLAFVTTACNRCGDGVARGAEACDGTDVGTATCASRGYTGGVLGCTAACALDESACTTCGDGTREGAEACDGTDVGTASCTTVPGGYSDGTLGCTAACAFDTSACNRCGDGVARGAEACDGTDLRGQRCADVGFLYGTLACGAGCALDTSACTNARSPAAGELVITEIMPNPTAIGDTTGEWFEVRNVSSALLSLGGCVVSDNQATPSTFTIAAPLDVPAGAIVTFAKSASPGFTPTYVYPSGWDLSNTGDEIRITCAGTMIDTVTYGTAFPFAAGVAMSLDPDTTTAAANDLPASWCAASTPYGSGSPPDRGTPGTANPDCAAAPVENCTNGTDDDGDSLVDCADVADCASAPACAPLTIGFCRLHFPATTAAAPGATSEPVFGRVWVAGLTDRTTGNDLDTRLVAALGRGPDGSSPTGAGWTWAPASPNAGYPGPGAEANNDEYVATFTAPGAAGSYDYAFRFSGDGGASWTYCDLDAGPGSDGSEDGYQATNAGALTVAGTLCTPVVNEVSVAGTGGASDELVELFNPCSAAVDLTGWRLVYRSASGTSDTLIASLTGSLAPGGYRLYVGGGYVGGGTPDGTFGSGTGVLAAAGGGVALRDATMAIVDSMGYGTATNAFVETTATTAPGSNMSSARTPNGADTNDNAADFAVRARTPGAANP